jgi:glycosyltransferase involved in cell wall biosynthesis
MKVLNIGTDRKLFDQKTPVFQRHMDYASKMEGLFVIVFSLKNQNLKYLHIDNLHIYPTNSRNKLEYVNDAVIISKKIVKENKIDVISTQDPFETGLLGYLLKKKYKLPLHVQVHTDFLSPYFKNSILNIIRVYIGKRIIKKADRIRVVSEVVRDSLNKNNIDVLPVFVDINELMNNAEKYPESSHSGSSILMLSRFSKEKRIDLALKVFKKVSEKEKNAEMTIVGSGGEKGKIKRMIMEFGLSLKIKLLEWESEPLKLYKSHDIFLLTSEYEGYGMTLIEAAASGIPIVTTKVGIAKTDLFKNGENSFVCPVGDINCLADSIITLLNDSEKRKLFSQRMQDSIKKTAISKEEYVNRYVGLLEKLIKND